VYVAPQFAMKSPPTERLLAAVLVAAILTVMYVLLSGYDLPDWQSYEYLYTRQGGWLAAAGRDPIFTGLLHIATLIFGSNGYEPFRITLFVIFTLIVSWVAYISPHQKRLGVLSPLVVAIVLVTTMMIKGLIQIREGLAFLFILVPVAMTFRSTRRSTMRTGLGSIIAAFTHLGTGIYVALWLAAVGTSRLGRKSVGSARFGMLILCISIVIGLALGFVFLRNSYAVRLFLQDTGVNISGYVVGGTLKYAYWLVVGGLILTVRHQIRRSVMDMSEFQLAYATCLVSGVLPSLYVTCIALVFSNFYTPALTTMVIRLLFTGIELALVLVVVRGGATFMTLLVAFVMLADRARIIVPLPV